MPSAQQKRSKAFAARATTLVRRCTACGLAGHDKRVCPQHLRVRPPVPRDFEVAGARRCSMIRQALRLVVLLSHKELTYDQIAEATGMKVRSVYRMIAALQAEGIPVRKNTDGHHNYYFVARRELKQLLNF